MERIAELLGRVERLKGSDRELDYEIAIALGWERRFAEDGLPDDWRKADWSWTREDSDHPPRYTEILYEVLPLLQAARIAGASSEGSNARPH